VNITAPMHDSYTAFCINAYILLHLHHSVYMFVFFILPVMFNYIGYSVVGY